MEGTTQETKHRPRVYERCEYYKLRSGSWGVRGPFRDVRRGAFVTVFKKNGESNTEIVAKVLWANGDCAIAAIIPLSQAKTR